MLFFVLKHGNWMKIQTDYVRFLDDGFGSGRVFWWVCHFEVVTSGA